MYDYVSLANFKCPICLRPIIDGQTKDTDCRLKYVDLYDPRIETVASLCFYCNSYIKIEKDKENRWLVVSATKCEKLDWGT